MAKKYIVGGPSNSGKSTFLLSLIEHLKSEYGLTAESIELDVWSRSYPAFRGEIPFKGRPKTVGLDWDWKTPLDAELKRFNAATSDIVFGDMPGKAIDEASEYMLENAEADAGIAISRSTDGLEAWSKFFSDKCLPVAYEILTFAEGRVPLILVGMDRVIRPDHGDVVAFGQRFAADLVRKK